MECNSIKHKKPVDHATHRWHSRRNSKRQLTHIKKDATIGIFAYRKKKSTFATKTENIHREQRDVPLRVTRILQRSVWACLLLMDRNHYKNRYRTDGIVYLLLIGFNVLRDKILPPLARNWFIKK